MQALRISLTSDNRINYVNENKDKVPVYKPGITIAELHNKTKEILTYLTNLRYLIKLWYLTSPLIY